MSAQTTAFSPAHSLASIYPCLITLISSSWLILRIAVFAEKVFVRIILAPALMYCVCIRLTISGLLIFSSSQRLSELPVSLE